MSLLDDLMPYEYKNPRTVGCLFSYLENKTKRFMYYYYYVETGCIEHSNRSRSNIDHRIKAQIESYGQVEILTHLIKYCKINATMYRIEMLDILDACNERLLEIKTIQQHSTKELDNIFPNALTQLIVNYMY